MSASRPATIVTPRFHISSQQRLPARVTSHDAVRRAAGACGRVRGSVVSAQTSCTCAEQYPLLIHSHHVVTSCRFMSTQVNFMRGSCGLTSDSKLLKSNLFASRSASADVLTRLSSRAPPVSEDTRHFIVAFFLPKTLACLVPLRHA